MGFIRYRTKDREKKIIRMIENMATQWQILLFLMITYPAINFIPFIKHTILVQNIPSHKMADSNN